MSVEKFVAIELTNKQLKALAPLLKHAREQALSGRQGIILSQPYGKDYHSKDAGKLRFGFVEMERAKVMLAVIEMPPVKP